ncbi:CPBP family intramembrane glutamic endopeptidase [Paenibacillus humicola]|uniref:CPBP family intramembrane glutamic endopeptidase n=1 Tax=Paenibacillus humicola TaxID=3110540 RepID=UPI00237AE434|nr:CPBP family intramembrane glutamic endopeptidase [Paenibacillus humicola]
MNDDQKQPRRNLFAWLGAAGIILFLLVQVLPSTSEAFFGNSSEKVIPKSAAERTAADFARRQFDQAPLKMETVYQSDSLFYGYLEKTKLTKAYDKKYDVKFPTDTYQVNADMPGGGTLFVYIHMEHGNIVGWNRVPDPQPAKAPGAGESRDAAVKFAVSQGFKANALSVKREDANNGTVWLNVNGYSAGDAKLTLQIRTERTADGRIRVAGYKPAFTVPQSYSSYVDAQERLAGKLSFIGSLLMSLVMFILAIIYAVLYRRNTSFVRGLVMAVLFLGMYTANNFNMKDALLASFGEDPDAALQAAVAVGFTCFLTAGMALAAYFSLVAGDGLWRSMGRSLWPRAAAPGYAGHVWSSMKLGYLFAFMLLGLQTIIFIVLMNATGAWSTTDVTQSPYNFAYPWLFPLLAWCAAISEEAVYRLFGIALLRKWFKNTFVAALIPTVIWALGHVTYPIFPSTTRLIELTIIGLILSGLMLRYGFMTVLFAHAVMDSVMMAVSLIFLGGAGNIVMGAVYAVLPAVIAWVIARFARWRYRTA